MDVWISTYYNAKFSVYAKADTVIHAQIVPRLVTLLTNDAKAIQKEAAWALSNIFAGTKQQIHCLLYTSDAADE